MEWTSKYQTTLAALTPIKLFVEMLKFSKNYIFKETHFVKENRESQIFWHEIFKFYYLFGKHVLKLSLNYGTWAYYQ